MTNSMKIHRLTDTTRQSEWSTILGISMIFPCLGIGTTTAILYSYLVFQMALKILLLNKVSFDQFNVCFNSVI